MTAQHSESVHGHLASDGHTMQCHECHGWYTGLATHVRLAYGMSAAAYRKEWGLATERTLWAEGTITRMRANALQRIDQAGPLEVPRFVAGTYVEHGAVGLEYERRAEALWPDRLAAAGWSSWQAAADWAIDNDKTWADIARALGLTGQEVRAAGMSIGVVIPPIWQRMLALAEEHVAATGTLLDADGELSVWLAACRGHLRAGDADVEASPRLDQLDPDWRLDLNARNTVAWRRGVSHAPVSHTSFAELEKRTRIAGFEDVTDFVRWAVVEHRGLAEMGEKVGIASGSILDVVTTDNPHDPFTATEALRLSRPGHLEDDGSRVQCHECGIWFTSLSAHLVRHSDDRGESLTVRTYRVRHDLPAAASLSSDGDSDYTLSAVWPPRLAAAGFNSPVDLFAHAAAHHLGTDELGRMLGVRSDTVVELYRGTDPVALFETMQPLMQSRHGRIATVDGRSQCHECGLWFAGLFAHVQLHESGPGVPFTSDSYRARFGLASTTSLSRRAPKRSKAPPVDRITPR